MAGTARATIEETFDSRIAVLEAQRLEHYSKIQEIDAKLGMARLLRDDLAPPEVNGSSAPE